jgi:glucuronate isomerase
MSFITDDFLLHSKTARELYHGFARDQPIFDYHCHLPPQDIANNRQFANLYEIWLEGDHYKWRAMRTHGVHERYITGDASPYEKFLAFAEVLPLCIRNPVYHWSHLELLRYFGIHSLLNPESAPLIWAEANEKLASPEFRTQAILQRFQVRVVCTTDDPVDSLAAHQQIASAGVAARVYPTFRPDKSLAIDHVTAWNQWVDQLEAISNTACNHLQGFLAALRNRHDFFHAIGGRLSDHGLETAYADFPSEEEATRIYERARQNAPVSAADKIRFTSYLMLFFAKLDTEKNWTKQLHIGALRNVNDAVFRTLGPDAGCDTIGDWNHALPLARYLGRLAGENILPKTILYNLNPADNYVFATMIGNFQYNSDTPGKIQFGSGWWFLDQKEGMRWQLNALSNLGILGHFVGMLTDSRSFMSYCRHEYFRRILCQLIGEDVDNGELPKDLNLLGDIVQRICYRNAENYFGLQV